MENNKPLLPCLYAPPPLTVMACVLAAAVASCGQLHPHADAVRADRLPSLFPPLSGTVIPPNIAPLNFVIREKGSRFFVTIAEKGKPGFAVASVKPDIAIPVRKWNALLSRAQGRIIGITVHSREGSRWRCYETVWDTVAADRIDPYLTYRKIPVCKDWTYMGIYQRELGSFKEKTVFHNARNGVCCNCHTFRNNDPNTLVLQIRSGTYGTPMLLGSRLSGRNGLHAVNTKSAASNGRAGFASWHPHEDLLAFTTNRFAMLFNAAGHEPREVFDAAADIVLCDAAANRTVSIPALSRKDRIETMPEWSSDGRFLYFCSAPQLPETHFREIRCDLMRIPFNPETRAWGTPDTLLTAREAGGSVCQPKCSPDGRYLLVNIAPYGDFPIDKDGGRLGVFDLQSSSLRVIGNSGPWTDGWHDWSVNGRWVVFTGKRINGRFSSLFFCFFDSTGASHAPFVLPQKDPSFYESSIIAFNVPEFLSAPLPYPARRFQEVLDAYRKEAAAPASAADAVQYE
jgi:hypothetical protein